MRKIIKLGLLGITFLVTVVTNASEKLNVKVTSETFKVLSISLIEVASNEVVSIKDFKGEVLFSEKLKKSDVYNKVFSFSTLPTGIYLIESKEEEKVQVRPIIVNEEKVTIMDSSSKTYLAPEVTIKGDIMRVLVRNYNNANVSIVVYDELGLLLNETKNNNNNTLVFGHYDIKKLASKKVTISVKEGEYNFLKEIEL